MKERELERYEREWESECVKRFKEGKKNEGWRLWPKFSSWATGWSHISICKELNIPVTEHSPSGIKTPDVKIYALF